jgi:hypothetical protein
MAPDRAKNRLFFKGLWAELCGGRDVNFSTLIRGNPNSPNCFDGVAGQEWREWSIA